MRVIRSTANALVASLLVCRACLLALAAFDVAACASVAVAPALAAVAVLLVPWLVLKEWLE